MAVSGRVAVRILTAVLVGVASTCLIVGFITSLALQPYPRPPSEEAPLIGALWQCSMLGFLVVGATLSVRRPRNPAGWVLLSFPVLFWASFAHDAVVTLAEVEGRSVSGAAVEFEWIMSSFGPPAMLAATLFLITTFPGGQPSRVGRWLLRFAMPVAAAWGGVRLFIPMPLDASGVVNPHGVAALAPLLEVNDGVGSLLTLILLLGGLELGRRYRRASGSERQQFRWVVRSLLFVPLGFAVSQVGEVVLSEQVSQFTDLLGIWIAAFGVAAGLGVAVLRYRLYDIDRVVSRTVGYVLVMAVLVGLYAGGVLAFSTVARSVTGEPGDLAVAFSTLLVAAAFQPVRRRVQDVVDKRFNRARYDAARTTDVFTQRLRDHVELTAVRGDLLGAVRESIAPASLSLWLVGDGPQ